jgi:RNA polymerase sigma-70 factor (ECF subfamily)
MADNPGSRDPGEPSDQWLLEQFQEGNQDAATEIFLRYAPRLRGLARAQCSPALARCVEAEDIVQSVFRSFFRRAQNGYYDIPEEGELWRLFLVITLNKIRAKGDFYHAAKRDIRQLRQGLPPDRVLAGRNQRTAEFLQMVLDEAMAKLPAHHRQIIELRIQGYDLEEIADKVQRAKRTVERVLQQFRIVLKDLLEEKPGS